MIVNTENHMAHNGSRKVLQYYQSRALWTAMSNHRLNQCRFSWPKIAGNIT